MTESYLGSGFGIYLDESAGVGAAKQTRPQDPEAEKRAALDEAAFNAIAVRTDAWVADIALDALSDAGLKVVEK